MKKAVFLFIALLLIPGILICEQNPPDINWKKIETRKYKIVFSEEITDEAQRIANILEYLHPYTAKTIGGDFSRLSLLVNNRSMTPNGYFVPAPIHSAWYVTPFQDESSVGTADWFRLLSLHEMRHAAQYEKQNSGFTKFIGSILGQEPRAILSQMSKAEWFDEGDAVCTETSLSDFGRGRIPDFEMPLRAILLSDEAFSYDQAFLGSYKRFYPNHYSLGYFLTAYMRRDYGVDAWERVLEKSSRLSFWPWSFSGAIAHVTGKNISGYYEETMNDLTKRWQANLDGLDITSGEPVNTTRKCAYTSYEHAQYLQDGSIVAVKSGLDLPSTLVNLSPFEEKKLRQISYRDYISASAQKVTWAHEWKDIRWGKQTFSDIFIYDLKTREEKQLTHKSKLLAPSLSPDGLRIVAVEYTPLLKCSLVFIRVDTGEELGRVPSPENDYIRTPSWSSDGRKIVFTHSGLAGTALSVMDVETKKLHTILPYGKEVIGRPIFYKDYILHNSSYSGIGNIFAVHLQHKNRFQITSSKFGAYNPSVSVDGRHLFFQDYTVDGYDISKMSIDESRWRAFETVKDESIHYYEPLVSQEQGGNVFEGKNIPKNQYEITEYNKLSNLINFHSFSLYYQTPVWHFAAKSTNKMDTMGVSAGVVYHSEKDTLNPYISAVYSGFYPVLKFRTDLRERSERKIYDYQIVTDKWDEKFVSFGFQVPWHFSRGIYKTSLTIGADLEYIDFSDMILPDFPSEVNGNIYPVSYNFLFSRSRISSMRDIYPTWGQTLNTVYRHTPFKGEVDGTSLTAFSSFFFPGIFKHHSFYFQANGIYQDREGYEFLIPFKFVRGYSEDDFLHETLMSGAFNYTLPLWYPDMSVGSVLYFKRLWTNIFYDYGIGEYDSFNHDFSSTGIEMMFDFHLFQLKWLPLRTGLQYIYKFNEKEYQVRIFSLSLFV